MAKQPSSLSSAEKALVDAAKLQTWTDDLRNALCMAVAHRGYRPGPYDTVGELADFLERLAS